MTLTVDTLEGIPEGLHEYFTKTDEGFSFDAVRSADVSGLKSKNSELLGKLKDLKTKAAQYDGLNLDEIKSMKAQLAALRKQKHVDSGDIEALEKEIRAEAQSTIEQMAKKHEEALSKATATSEKMKAALEAHLIEARAVEAITAERGAPKLLLPIVRQHVRVVEEDGGFSARVVDADGNIRVADGKGTPLGLQEFVAELKVKDEYARAFDAETKPGAGTLPGANRPRAGQTINRKQFDALDSASRMTFVREGGTITD